MLSEIPFVEVIGAPRVPLRLKGTQVHNIQRVNLTVYGSSTCSELFLAHVNSHRSTCGERHMTDLFFSQRKCS